MESWAGIFNSDCAICLERFTSPVKTKCGHIYCKKCIERALQFDPYCPTCKTPLRSVTGKQPHGGSMTHLVKVHIFLIYCACINRSYHTQFLAMRDAIPSKSTTLFQMVCRVQNIPIPDSTILGPSEQPICLIIRREEKFFR